MSTALLAEGEVSRMEEAYARVLFEDADIIVYDKKGGMPSVPLRASAVKVQGRGVITASGVEMPRPRSEQFAEAIRNAARTKSDSDAIKSIFDKLKEPFTSLPRREHTFKQHVGRVVKVDADSAVLADVWDRIHLEDTKLRYPRGFIDSIPDDMLSAADVVSEMVGVEIYVVHRLDMETSGVMIFAKNSSTCNTLNEQFRLKKIEKKYLAEVHGRWDCTCEKVYLKMRPDLDNRPMQIVDSMDGKDCETSIKVLRYRDDSTILEMRPVTGRTHQLRVHTSALGHPILGDTLYASEVIRNLSPDGLRLHAQEINFYHPKTGERMKVESRGCPFDVDLD